MCFEGIFQKLTAVRNSSGSNESYLWINSVMLRRANMWKNARGVEFCSFTFHSTQCGHRDLTAVRRDAHWYSSLSFSFSKPNPYVVFSFFSCNIAGFLIWAHPRAVSSAPQHRRWFSVALLQSSLELWDFSKHRRNQNCKTVWSRELPLVPRAHGRRRYG